MTGLSAKWCLPSSVQTDKLASLKAKLKKAAAPVPIKAFPFVEVASFLPTWASVSKSSPEEGDGETKVRQRMRRKMTRPLRFLSICQEKRKGKLDIVRWIAAFQDLALASSAAEACSLFLHPFCSHCFAAPTCHVGMGIHGFHGPPAYMPRDSRCVANASRDQGLLSLAFPGICLFLAFCSGTARAEDRSFTLGQLYDEVCRKEWSERAYRGMMLTSHNAWPQLGGSSLRLRSLLVCRR